MSVQTYVPDASLARYTAQIRARGDDPRGYDAPRNKRVDMKFMLNPAMNELFAVIEQRAIMDVVRVKNTTGSSWTAPKLLKWVAGKLTAQTTATASNSPSGGASITYLVSATFEVGQIVKVVSGGRTDYGIVSAVSAGVSVTIDFIWYDHTTPTVTALPAYEASLADADDTSGANWVVTETIANGSYGWAYGAVESADMGTTVDSDGGSPSVEDLVYLSGTAGGWTKTAPTGVDQQQQVVGVVKTSHASAGRIQWFPGARWFTKFGGNMLQSGATPSDWKDSVRAATTAALAANTRSGNVLTANANGALGTIDGVTMALNDRVLVKNEATGANNGIYYISDLGSAGTPWTMTRAADADISAEVTPDIACLVEEGTTNADTAWILATNGPITLNTTALTFTQLSGGGGAPADAQYVTLATNSTLTNERVATAGSGIALTDAGAGSTLTFALDINGLTAVSNPLLDSFMMPLYDATAGANRKIALSSLLAMPLHVFLPQDNQPPSASFATLDTRNNHPVLNFDDAGSEYAYFGSVLSRAYRANGITVDIYWAAASATSGNVLWGAAIERVAENAQDMDSDGWDTEQSAAAAATNGTSGKITKTSIAFTNSQIDGLLAGEPFRLKIRRQGGDASDTMTGDAQIIRVEIRET